MLSLLKGQRRMRTNTNNRFISHLKRRESSRQKLIERGFLMIKTVSFDIGYSSVKAKNILFPSVVGAGKKIRYSTGIGADNELDNLNVRVDGQEYFVGNLALTQSPNILFSLTKDRYDTKEAVVLLETILALLAGKDEEVDVMTGLPLDYFNAKDAFAKKLQGTHSIYLNGELRTTHVRKAKVMPQPMGVFFDQLIGEYGGLQHPNLVNETIGIVDIGFGSTDIAYVKNGVFVDHLSRSTDIAMNRVYKMVRDNISQDLEVYKEIYELEEIIRTNLIKIKGTQYTVQLLIEEAKKQTAQQLVSWVSTIWKDRGDFDKIVIAGGGGAALFPTMQNTLDAELAPNPQMSVYNGFRKSALWKVDAA